MYQAVNAVKPSNNIIQPSQIHIPENIISISPGGFMGIYMFGICTYIKENYNLDPYVFSGASAGAWNALMLTYKPLPFTSLHDLHLQMFENKVLNSLTRIQDIELWLKQHILNTYEPNRFDLSKLYIGTTTLHATLNTKTTIFHDFKSLEEAIDCCIASSHIPFLTGGIIHKFRSQITFDGGFSRNPYLTNKKHKHVLHIKPSMWTIQQSADNPMFNTTLFSRDAFQFKELYEKGYTDAKTNKCVLDSALEHPNEVDEE
jgi:hypothetical protein